MSMLATKKGLKKVFSGLKPGDLVCVEWCDASVGKSSRVWGLY